MSGSASLDLERSLLQHSLAIAPMPALGRVYVALCLSAPTETAGGIEASGGGYARAAATFALMASPSNAASNTTSLEFLAATSAWGTIGYFEIWTQITGGTRLYWGPLTDPADGVPIEMDVVAGDVVRFSAGALVVQAADTAMPGDGPWLPLSGGTVTGATTFTAAVTGTTFVGGGANGNIDVSPAYNGAYTTGVNRNYPTATAELVRYNYAVGGAVGAGQTPIVEMHAVNAEAVDASLAQGGGLSWFSYAGSLNAGAVGGRTAFGSHFSQNGATTCAPGQYYVAGAAFADAAYSAGGAVGSHRGSLFGFNDSALLKTGATNWESMSAHEVNVGAQTGTSVNYKIGVSVVQWGSDRVAGLAGKDYAFGLSAQDVCAGWDFGYSFGSAYGWWPMKPTGTLIGTIPDRGGGPAYAAAWGIDFSAVTFSGGLIRGPGFSVDGAGKLVSVSAAVGGASGPTWTTGSAAPTATAPVGSLYSRAGGAVGATLYVSRGAGTWAAVAGV